MRFSDFTRNLCQIRRSPVSWLIVGLVAGIQLAVSLAGGPDARGMTWWYETFGLSREGVLLGRVWQLISYGLLHGGWLHAGFNVLFVLVIGSRIEHVAGHSALWKVVLAGVVSGGVFHLILGAELLVGLSGGCLALLLFLTTISPQSRMFPLPVSGRSLGVGIMAAELILALINPALGIPVFSVLGRWLVANGMEGWFQIGHACHLGGGLAGWLCARWLLRPRVDLKRLRRDRARREAE